MIYTEHCFVNGLKFNLETRCYVRHRTLSCHKYSPSLIKVKRKITCVSKFAQIKCSKLIYCLYGYNVHVHLIQFLRSCTCRSAYMYFLYNVHLVVWVTLLSNRSFFVWHAVVSWKNHARYASGSYDFGKTYAFLKHAQFILGMCYIHQRYIASSKFRL